MNILTFLNIKRFFIMVNIFFFIVMFISKTQHSIELNGAKYTTNSDNFTQLRLDESTN